MNRFLIALFLFSSLYASSSAQTVNLVPLSPAPIKPDSNGVYTIVPKMPEYPLGKDSLSAFIERNLERPEGYINAIVYIHFVVSTSGKLTDFKIVKGVDPGLDSAAVKCIRNMPDWYPGELNGQSVKVRYTMALTFIKNGNVFTKDCH